MARRKDPATGAGWFVEEGAAPGAPKQCRAAPDRGKRKDPVADLKQQVPECTIAPDLSSKSVTYVRNKSISPSDAVQRIAEPPAIGKKLVQLQRRNEKLCLRPGAVQTFQNHVNVQHDF